MRRNSFKNWCGYVVIPSKLTIFEKCDIVDNISYVHGGITFEQDAKESGIEYKGKKDDDYIIGFDTSHHQDYTPFSFGGGPDLNVIGAIYKDKNYVISECENICDQLIEKNIIKDVKSLYIKKINK